MTKAVRHTRAPGRRKRLTRTQTEPALVRAGIVSVLGLLAGLGVGWAADVNDATIGHLALAWIVLAPLVQGWWTRHGVTAARAVLAWVTTRGQVVAGDASERETGTQLMAARHTAPYTGGRTATVYVPVKRELLE